MRPWCRVLLMSGVLITGIGARTEASERFSLTWLANGRSPHLLAQSAETLATLQKAQALYSTYQYDAAIAELDVLLQRQPTPSEAWYLKGRCHLQLKQPDLAMMAYNRALEEDARNPKIWHARGDIFYYAQRYPEALGSYKEAVNYRSAAPIADQATMLLSFALTNLVLAVPRKGEETVQQQVYYRAALESYDQAIGLLSGDSTDTNQLQAAWWQRSEVLRRLGEYPEALDSIDRSLRLDPNFPEGWYRKGLILRSLKKFGEAVTSYRKALELAPSYAEAHHNLGLVLSEDLKQYPAAIAEFDAALAGENLNRWNLETDLSKANSWYSHGAALFLHRCYSQARASIEAALKLEPNYPKALELQDYLQKIDSSSRSECQKWSSKF
jgi:tetratricopeptide (TPR) repeat protein